MDKLRVCFMGTPEFAVATLDAVRKAGHEVVCVVTTPDKPAGRGQQMRCSDVKQYAVEHQLPLLQPEKLKEESFVETLCGCCRNASIRCRRWAPSTSTPPCCPNIVVPRPSNGPS